MGKGEIAHYEQFLPFPRFPQKACFPGVSKGVIVWEWVNSRQILTYLPNPIPKQKAGEKRKALSFWNAKFQQGAKELQMPNLAIEQS